MRIEALRGHVGMLALLRAFHEAGRDYELRAIAAVSVEEARGAYHLLFRIGETTAALSLPETQWFADQLINHWGGPMAGDMERLGRAMLSMLADAPGPHGVH